MRSKNAVVNPSFADDITLAASDATDCQQSINTMQEIVTWTKLWHSNQVNADHGLEGFLEMVKKPSSPSFKIAHIHFMIHF